MMRSFHLKISAIALSVALLLTTAVSPFTEASASRTADELFSGTPAGDSTYHFSDIQFLNSTTGRAAGNGFLIGTSDAGSSWQSIYKGTWQFTQLDFISNTTGWALARSSSNGPNALIHTTDGGSTFTKIPMGSIALERIQFTDANHGFGYTRAYSYRTSNSGKSWTRIATPANTRYAEFTDELHGWALVIVPGYGYKLYRTTNGGASWATKLTVKSDEVSGGAIYTSGIEVWAKFNGGAGMSQQSYSVYASSNNGASWRKVISQATAGGGDAPGGATGVVDKGPASPGGHASNMVLVDGTAILAGFSPAGGIIGVGRSLNEGKSWTNFTGIQGFENVIVFTSKNDGWMADTSLNSPALYRTTDGGQTWSKKLAINTNN